MWAYLQKSLSLFKMWKWILKLINNSWHYKPTRAPLSGQVDDFETQWNTSWKSLVFHHVFITSDKLFLICIFIDYSITA